MSDNEAKDKKQRCFVIMPFTDPDGYDQGHFLKIYNQIFVEAIKEAGYEPYRVDENKICDSIIDKIFDAIQNCEMALCDLSGKNPNVLYELGLRQAYNKPVVLVKDNITDKIFDISGISTIEYNSSRLYEDVIEARESIKTAIIATREGKEDTLVDILHSTKAPEPFDGKSEEDSTNIMLRRILYSINELQNQNDSEYEFKIGLSNYKLRKSVENIIRDWEKMKNNENLTPDEINQLNNRILNVLYHSEINSEDKTYIILQSILKETKKYHNQLQ